MCFIIKPQLLISERTKNNLNNYRNKITMRKMHFTRDLNLTFDFIDYHIGIFRKKFFD